ncbi:IclR family transcriptional regulator [Halanaerobium sp. MA284_MarDTE_T2]|uniref:IclR family transcriptional regulator n=1 Tax=Halanaerobium sp. MA284_MarDTE_T2 TaxID=2183913 RepID=UPI000DF15AAC|nr:IclR family transcriptional regulator [Halanaerobium sp. MA284_MarDTE_T2]RCW44384.1 IclR family transcriptional regulator [Halanaerobium sp. MA284_MarDTE_T2]
MNKEERYLNQSVINSFKIIECFNENNDEFTPQELSNLLNENSSSIWRLIRTLESIGYLIQTENNKYKLGYKLLNGVRSILNTSEIRKVAYPYLEELSKDTNFNVILSVLDKNRAVYLIRIPSPQIPDSYFHVGRKVPLYATASGKILLAYQPENKRKALIEKFEFKKFTNNTIVNKNKLYEHLEMVRENGFAQDNEEFIFNTNCLAVPIRDSTLEVVGSISISTRKLYNKGGVDLKSHFHEISEKAIIISNGLGASLYNPLGNDA